MWIPKNWIGQTLIFFDGAYNQLPEETQRRIDKIFKQRPAGDDGPITWKEWKASEGVRCKS